MQTGETPTLSDPWQSCLDAIGELPGAMLAEIDQAWGSLAEYEAELSNWYRRLVLEQQRLNEQAAMAASHEVTQSRNLTTPTRSPEPVMATVEPPPQVMRTVSTAARQFAALRRQRTGQRPLQ